jgi:zinc protease
MLMRGTKQRTFAEIYEALESVGATLEFDSGRHTTDFSIASLVEDLDLVLELLAESLRYPTFPADEVEQERGEILTGLQIRENDTRQMAGLKFRELLYGNHPYGRSPQGYSETIKELTRDDLARFHELHYGPSGMVIVVVGAVKADEAVGKIEAVLGDWQNSNWQPLPALPAVEPPIAKQRIYHSIPEKTQADIVLGWVGPERARPDYMAASMANTVLGVFGMMGRLGKNVREEQGLAYYAYSRLQGGLGQGPWLVSTGVAPEHVEVAIDSILEEVRRMREELTPDEELNDSKAYRTGSLPVSLETNDGIAGIISDMVLYDLGLDYLYRFPEIVNAISPAELQETAQRYMPLDTVSIAVVGPPL